MPSPFFARYLLEWLATQTISRAEQAVVQEVKTRVASGELGDYDGVLFKDSFKAKDGADRIKVAGVELGVVAATKRELIGLVDKMGVPKQTQGDSFKYYTGSWKGARIAIVQTGTGLERVQKGTEALVQAFRPQRVAAIGFATRLTKTLDESSLFIPDRLVDEDGSELDLNVRALPAPSSEAVPTDSENVDAAKNETSEEKNASAEGDATEELGSSETRRVFHQTFARGLLRRTTTGALATVENAPRDKEARKALRERTGAVAYDRAALGVARVCGASGVPFLPLFVVRKPDAQKVARDAARLANTDGQSVARTLGSFLGAITNRPSVALDVYKLKEDSLESADKLAKALGLILDRAVASADKSA